MIRDDIRGGNSGLIEVTDKGVSIEPETAKFIKLSNRNVQDDAALTLIPGGLNYDSPNTIFWGFGGKPAHQLFPTQETDWIPVNDLSDINLRARPGQTVTIYYSFLI